MKAFEGMQGGWVKQYLPVPRRAQGGPAVALLAQSGAPDPGLHRLVVADLLRARRSGVRGGIEGRLRSPEGAVLAADLSAAAGACCRRRLLLCAGQWAAAAAGPGSTGPRACKSHLPVVMLTLHSVMHVQASSARGACMEQAMWWVYRFALLNKLSGTCLIE